jgi:uncharacterized coiled-coil protein SlyX
MVEQAKTWLKENSTLVYFLIAQFIGAGALVVSMISYMVNLEARVAILETRGSSHLAEINNRLTVTEKETEGNKQRLDKVVDIMTRRLGADIK